MSPEKLKSGTIVFFGEQRLTQECGRTTFKRMTQKRCRSNGGFLKHVTKVDGKSSYGFILFASNS